MPALKASASPALARKVASCFVQRNCNRQRISVVYGLNDCHHTSSHCLQFDLSDAGEDHDGQDSGISEPASPSPEASDTPDSSLADSDEDASDDEPSAARPGRSGSAARKRSGAAASTSKRAPAAQAAGKQGTARRGRAAPARKRAAKSQPVSQLRAKKGKQQQADALDISSEEDSDEPGEEEAGSGHDFRHLKLKDDHWQRCGGRCCKRVA